MQHEITHWQNDPLWLDAMYNNRLRVADSSRILEQWETRSAVLRHRLRTENRAICDVAYGTDPHETLDIFLPTATARAPFPVLLYIHGGYWSALSKNDHSFVAERFTQQGIAVVVIDYSLCPAVHIRNIIDQCTRAVAWTYQNIDTYGGDAQNIVVCGHSAGGHLAAMLMVQNWSQRFPDLPALPIRQSISLSGLFDLEPIRHTPFLHMLNLTPEQVRHDSPIYRDPVSNTSLACFYGAEESDELIRQSNLIQHAWQEQTVPLCIGLDGTDHFSIVDALTRAGSILNDFVCRSLGVTHA